VIKEDVMVVFEEFYTRGKFVKCINSTLYFSDSEDTRG
jgi:hypothetical protein